MSKIQELRQKLQRARDELKVQAELGAMEARDEWEKLEREWDHFEAKAGLEKSAENVSAAVETLGEELHASYLRLKKALKS